MDEEIRGIVNTASINCIVCEGSLIEKFINILIKRIEVEHVKDTFLLVSMDNDANIPVVTPQIKIVYLSDIVKSGFDIYTNNPDAMTLLGIQMKTPIIVSKGSQKYRYTLLEEADVSDNPLLWKNTDNQINSLIFTSGLIFPFVAIPPH